MNSKFLMLAGGVIIWGLGSMSSVMARNTVLVPGYQIGLAAEMSAQSDQMSDDQQMDDQATPSSDDSQSNDAVDNSSDDSSSDIDQSNTDGDDSYQDMD